MDLAPIILLTYNRPLHFLKTLNALQKNTLSSETELYIYCDGPKLNATEVDKLKITKAREIAASVKWCKNLTIIHRDTNYGLQKSIIEGVSEIVSKHGKVIVLEDDIITSPHFLQYMNNGLNTYQDNDAVLSIGACNFFASGNDVPETFFAPIPDCWGWATWNDRWKLFEPNAQLLLNKLRETGLINEFNLRGKFNFESMLVAQIKGNVSSWAIRWQAVAYLTGKLTLYPKYAVTKNIGFDAEGTHTGGGDRYSKKILFARKPINIRKIKVAAEPHIVNKMINSYDYVSRPSTFRVFKTRVKKLIKYFLPIGAAKLYRRIKAPKSVLQWHGNYSSWQQAKELTSGYDDKLIFEKTLDATLKVKNGEAAFERDTTLFDNIEYNWPLLATLLKASIENNNCLSVMDFGGSLGSAYFQSRQYLHSLSKLEWSIIEQKHYTEIGNQLIADESLRFYASPDDCLRHRKPNILLLSSVLQYLEEPYNTIKELIKHEFDYIVIDRTAFINNNDRITIQSVPEYIYPASYPAWLLNQFNLVSAFNSKYELITEFNSYPELTYSLEDNTIVYYTGFILKKRN
jgi:putative methyltransferase (TIGR04325 family)